VIRFEIGKCECSKVVFCFVLFFQECFGSSESLAFPCEFLGQCVKVTRILIGVVMNLSVH
jgi:hypothetical protein